MMIHLFMFTEGPSNKQSCFTNNILLPSAVNCATDIMFPLIRGATGSGKYTFCC